MSDVPGGGSWSERIYGEQFSWPVLPPSGEEDNYFGREILIYSTETDTDWSNTLNGWRFEVMRPREALIRDYGLDNIEIMHALEPYADDYVSVLDGAEGVDAFWRDWRDAYAATWGV